MENYTQEYWQNLIGIGRENKKEETAKQVKLAPAKLDKAFLGWVESLEVAIFHGQEYLSTYFIVPTELLDWAQAEIRKKAADVGLKVTNESREDEMIRFTLARRCNSLIINGLPMDTKEKIYTLLRPVMDYEESETVFVAFSTKEGAVKARAELVALFTAAREEIGEQPEVDPDVYQGEKWEKYEEWDKNRDEVMKGVEFPYKSEDIYRYDVKYGHDTPESLVVIGELPLIIC